MSIGRRQYKIMEPQYKVFWRGSICYYCGDKADTMDHVPSISLAHSMGALHLEQKGIQLLKVSCCRECNSELGDRMHVTLETRGRFLYRKYLKKYKKVIYSKDWNDEDLSEYGPNLRSFLQNHADIKKWIERRLAFMEEVLGIAA